jgi:enoyl-[acyl-carrier protein] reductase III
MFDLSGRVALVTGASRGIGRACALRLAEAGADVIVNFMTSQAAAEQTAHEITALGRKTAIVRADVSEREDVVAMIGMINEQFGRLDILISNAASGGFRPLLEATAKNFEAAMSINALALVNLLQAAVPLLAQPERRAKVVALSSHGSHRALPAYGLIGASKAALASLVRHFALELGDRGINVNVLEAGLVETDSTRRLPGAREMLATRSQHTLVGDRILEAGDVADAVLFLASPLSDMIQGQTIVVDGGASIRI